MQRFKFKTIDRWGEGSQIDPARIYFSLSALENLYPHFASWFASKVMPDVNAGSRAIFVCLDDNVLKGIVIAKRTHSERKLCTVWICDRWRQRGIGADLMKSAIDWLGCKHPLISVPQQRISEFRPLFTRWGFQQTQTLSSYYVRGSKEYVFNGRLPERRLTALQHFDDPSETFPVRRLDEINWNPF